MGREQGTGDRERWIVDDMDGMDGMEGGGLNGGAGVRSKRVRSWEGCRVAGEMARAMACPFRALGVVGERAPRAAPRSALGYHSTLLRGLRILNIGGRQEFLAA